jgi:signal transduction histidine kinase
VSAPPLGTQPESTNPPSPERFPIVVVDDEPAIRTLIARQLMARGYKVTAEGSSEKALVLLKDLPPPILVVDKNLPGMTGLDLVETLRKARHDFEAILVTAHADVESLSRSVSLGFFRCLLKPYDTEDLYGAVAGAANRLLLRLDLRVHRAQLEARNAELETKVEELEEARHQRMLGERLASIGRLAAGVAHEINTPLAAIIANLALMAEELGRGAAMDRAQVEEMLSEARQGAERVRVIVRDLKTFSRGDEERVGAVDLRHIIEATLNMAFTEIRHRARLVKDYGETRHVQGNQARLGQVVLNLLLNAAEAIPEGSAAQNEIRIVTRDEGEDGVVMEIRDTGTGIAPALLERIFDPFFTTKPIGVGTGLGLSISHGIVKSYGGDIVAESAAGKGSILRVTLVAAAAVRVEEPKARGATPQGKAKLRVLVVDDDPLFLSALRRVLGRDNDLVALTDAREALSRLRSGDQYDAILSDLMMPDMTGMDFHAELMRTSPQQANSMIFLTGGTFTPSAQDFLDRVPNLRLAKPFDPQQLRALLATRSRS